MRQEIKLGGMPINSYIKSSKLGSIPFLELWIANLDNTKYFFKLKRYFVDANFTKGANFNIMSILKK